jgi:small subunit ribosomal protein S1
MTTQDAAAAQEAAAPATASDTQEGKPAHPRADKPRGERGDNRGANRGDNRGDKRRERRPHAREMYGRGRRMDDAPPRFNVDELAALAGAPLWQSVHDAVIADVTEAAVFVDVKPLGHAPLRAAVKPGELAGKQTGAAVRVRLGDPPKTGDAVPTASVLQAEALDHLDALKKAMDDKAAVPGFVVREVKGGFSVSLFAEDEDGVDHGVRAFLPASQASLFRYGPRGEEIVGTAATFDLAELESERANVVVTRKRRLAAERKENVQKQLAEIKEGDVFKATVKSIVAYGAFLDVGGVDAMVHQSDLTWDGRARAQDVLKVGQTLDVKVIHKNPETGKIKVGVKQLAPDPWAEMRAAFAEGSVVKGTVVALADFGAFVRLSLPRSGEHVEGLIHVSELSWTKVKHPSQKLHIGDEIDVKVLGLDTAARRISLSTKALERNPFEAVAEKFPEGTVVKAKVKSLADFGAFVELADGVDGMIHIGELSWIAHPNHPSELLNIGQEVEAAVVNIDIQKQRVGLSIKRTQPNPFDAWEKKYKKGARLKMKVTRVDDRGAHLEVEEGLTCFCPTRDLIGKEGDGRVERGQDAVRIGSMVDVQVLNFDRRFKKVSVSMRAVVDDDTREAYDEYKKKEASEGHKLNALADKLKNVKV